jgi:hypothetical protein
MRVATDCERAEEKNEVMSLVKAARYICVSAEWRKLLVVGLVMMRVRMQIWH